VRAGARTVGWSIAVVLLVGLPLPYLLRFDHGHTATAAILTATLCALAVRSPAAGAAVTLGFLAMQGDFRRYAGYFEGYPSSDALLLVAPMTAFFLCCMTAVRGHRVSGSGALSITVLLLAALMAAQIFNPAQGGFIVGLGGALFYLVPLLWFWIGRVYGDRATVELVLRWVIVPLGVAAAALGLWQSLRGLLPFEAAWVDATNASVANYNSVFISQNVVRAFGFFNSSSEYARFLLLASVVIVALWLTNRSRWIWLLPALLAAVFLVSSRGPVVFFVLTAVVLWAVHGRNRSTWLPRLLVAGVAGFSLLAAGLLGLRATHLSDRVDALVSHQVEGLLDPANTEKSTAVGHLALTAQGVLEGFVSPAGRGLGSTTLAASKFGSGVYSAEMDFANVFYSLGFIGGFLYLTLIALAIGRALSVWNRRRTATELAMLGVLICTTTAWMIGGEYSIAATVWFVIGAVDRSYAELAVSRQRALRDAYRARHA
jgi:hypothetical protein